MLKSLVIVLCLLSLGAGFTLMLAPALLNRSRLHSTGRVGDVGWLFHPATELVGLGIVGVAVAITVLVALG